ncbi:uncharacterized protein N7503_009642 [Penicillium pulvis]|uniref:uncharacterized protein n=1 Tax=Penicillium pulvis TaxID=1562058 RepID=UPI002548AFB8|nr:uncharacterized protein N7503_009642 [Penicillium pulvis]KAJ5784430.1 hypothetical protein N7503_009642 [Penicillium pulvis]
MSCMPSPAGDPPTISARPKLTLQTTSLPRTFGSSTTGLSRSCTAAPGASPTVGNTFKNAYDIATPASATSSPSKGPSHRFPSNKPISPYVHNNNNPFNYRPYQLPLGVRSILRNSPLDTASRRRSGSISAGANNGPGGAGARRVFFPTKKQVSYRVPIEEEIRTERYTAQHLDLVLEEEEKAAKPKVAVQQHEADRGPETQPHDSTQESDANQSLSESSTSDEASADEGIPKTTLSKLERKKRRTMRTERQVRAVALLDGLESDQYGGCSTPQTPQGRVKRRREWKWTLGPINTDIATTTSSGSVSSATTTPETPSVSSASTVDEPKPETQSFQDQ